MIWLAVIGLVLGIIAHLADFVYQTDQHGWKKWYIPDGEKNPSWTFWTRWVNPRFEGTTKMWTWQWGLNRDAKKWPWWADWIPHDGFHLVQSIRNNCAWVAVVSVVVAAVFSWPRWGALTAATSAEFTVLVAYLVALTGYAVARGLGFTLPMKLLRGSTT